jgi:glycosyltransferase involved in cell wall biosynthesis
MERRKRVLMLLSNPFRPDPRVHKEAEGLVRNGYDVTIYCWDREAAYEPVQKYDGINLVRLGPRSAFSNPVLFLVTMPFFWLRAFLKAMKQEFDIVHCHDLDTLPLGILASRLKSRPLVYDSHEIYSSMVQEEFPGIVYGITRIIERWLVKKPLAVICVNNRFQGILNSWGVKSVTVIMGCPPRPEASPGTVAKIKANVSPDGKPIVLYIGVLERHRNLLELATGFTSGKCPGARLLIGGFGSLEREVSGNEGERVRFIGPVNPKDTPAYTLASDIMVAVYDPAYGNNRDSVPNKLFEAMSTGKPIIVAKGTWTGQTVERLGCGVAVQYGTDTVFQAIDRLMADSEFYKRCALKGKKAFEEEYNWPMMEKRLLHLYDRLSVPQN